MRLKDAARLLSESGIEDALFEARLIFSECEGIPKERLLVENPEAGKRTRLAVKRRASHEPLAYILGYTYFYREKYTVSPACLVPRQETELLVDLAVKSIPEGESFLDLCTGSGCIAVSVLKNTKNTRAIAADISKDALELAKKNAIDNGVNERVELLHADVLSAPLSSEVFAVLSNPPYIKDSLYGELPPEVLSEPKCALLGGHDGADFYRHLTALYKNVIKKDGFILFEIGFDQGEILKQIAEENALFCEIKKDYSALDRLALLKRKN